jgi:uncharacterized paraquat-inducible protein A
VDQCHYHPTVRGWRVCPGCAITLCVMCLEEGVGGQLACPRCHYVIGQFRQTTRPEARPAGGAP